MKSSPLNALLIWLGGGDDSELGERQERATHAVAGLIVLIGAALAALVATVAAVDATDWPLAAVLPVTLASGALVGAVTRVIATGSTRGWRNVLGRVGVGLAIGVVVGELAALAVFAGAVDRGLEQLAVRDAESAPAVVSAAAGLERARTARTALDEAVERARTRRDDALVVARCEYHPTPACPQTRITGVPGAGPETRTAQDLLADAQRELDQAVTVRESRTPELDGNLTTAEQTLAQARRSSAAAADRGLGARWIAMNDYTRTHASALVARLGMIAAFTLLTVLPLIITLWRGETSQDRRAAARTEVDRAERQAEIAIAVKQAEVRAAAESLWAEQQLVQTQLAVQAQTLIDEAQQHRRVTEALDGPIAIAAQRDPQPDAVEDANQTVVDEPVLAELPAAPDRLPARVDSDAAGTGGLIPAIPDLARTAARWIRPLVPPVVTRVIDTTTKPVRSARRAFEEVFEEVEEITFTLKRTRRVNVHSVTADDQPADDRPQAQVHHQQVRRVTADRLRPVLSERGPAELTGPGEPLELPPG